ncbi:MAG: helicase-exonuclease AddAB subunit AddA [Bacilli bacterium]|nr:helicase-exonuclease AddAB subunit AddA [Bacilli bacterium]
MKWTNEQSLAINERGGKIIVSAAAGSGKTAVLSARIIDYILKGGSIDKLLVVTFTTLAAGEMKERIKKNINNAIINDPTNTHLQEQLLLVELAQIMTMDAFYNKLIKENFARLNISPDFKVIDEIEYKVVKLKTAKEVVEMALENNINIKTLLDNFIDYKNGTTIEDLLISFDEYINKMPNSDSWLEELLSNYEVDDFNNSLWSNLIYSELKSDFEGFKTLYDDVLEEIKLDDTLYDKLNDFLLNEREPLIKVIEAINNKDFSSLTHLIKTLNFERFPTIKGYSDNSTSVKIKAIRASLKKVIKDYEETILYFGESFKTDLEKINIIIKELIEITKIYRQSLKTFRETNNVYSFDDIPHLVLQLLVKDYNFKTGVITKSSYADTLSNNYDEILIDEFQDTNLVQNIIFSSLSKNDNNLFIVGDVKQSIYGFRSARPDLLIKEKKDAYSNKFPRLINLSKNFRSRQEVLDFSNYLFSKIMSDNYGDINYDESEVLNLGASYLSSNDNDVELHLLTNLTIEDEEDLEEDISNYEKEAVVVAKRIKELFDSNYQVIDSKTNKYRNILKSDIAILLRSPGAFGNILRETLINYGIEVYTDRAPVYFDNYEVKLIISLLKIIDNPYDDISLVAVLRSPIFGFSEDELLEIRNIDKHNSFIDNLRKKDTDKISDFLNRLNDYQNNATTLKISKLLNYLYNDTKILAIMSALDNGRNRVKNLLEMINHAQKYIDNGHSTLHEFITYVDTLIDNDYSLEGVNPASDKDSVLITTIHKSKGLEFPVVILPRLDKQFNFEDLKKDILMDNDYYLGFKLRNHDDFSVNSNLILEVIKKEKKLKQLSEELRVLYVALTRAKEKLIMTGVLKNIPKKIKEINSMIGNESSISLVYLKQSKSMLDWIIPIILKHQSGRELREMADVDTKLYNDEINLKLNVIDLNTIVPLEQASSSDIIKIVDINYMADVLNYSYPYQQTNYKQKMSVTELKETRNNPLKPKFIDSGIQFQVGNTYHKILEYLPFIEYNDNTLKEAINKLVTDKLITLEELKLINIKKISNFFKDEIYLEKILGSNIYREHQITFTININELEEEETNLDDEIVIEGIIDLFCEKNNFYYLVDYKSDIVTNEQELITRYKKQLDLYEHALAKKTKGNIKKYIYSFHFGKFIEI